MEDKDGCRLTGMACASCMHYMALFMEELEFWSWKLIRRDYVMVGLRQRLRHGMGAKGSKILFKTCVQISLCTEAFKPI